MPRQMRQEAPYPEALAALAARLSYRRHLGWEVTLDDDLQRDKPGRHAGESRGLTLVVERHGPDSYHPYNLEQLARRLLAALAGAALPGPAAAAAAELAAALGRALTVHHYFPVPPATFDEETWMRWLFDTLGLVDLHERMEDFTLVEHGDWVSLAGDHVTERTVRPFAPNHGPGRNPYVVHQYAGDETRRMSFRGDLSPG